VYIPPQFEESRVEVLHQLIRTYSLGTLVTLSASGMEANHIPFHLTPEPTPFGTLQGHMARANPMWKSFNPELESLIIFHGPGGYVSPSWYPTVREHGKGVPTWNYAVVHAYGQLRVINDAAWVREQSSSLTAQQESAFDSPWSVADAPQDFIEGLVGSIVGIELTITRLIGKWKISQNQPEQNRDGVIQGLRAQGTHQALELAESMEKYFAK
jgi:transcriptional regulator